jgi:hypothetical protein
MRAAVRIVIGSAVLASAMLVAPAARASIDPTGFDSSAPLERVLAATATGSAPLLGEWRCFHMEERTAHVAVRAATTPSSSTRKVARAVATHRRHLRTRHTEPNLHARHPLATALPLPTRRPVRTRVPSSSRNAPSPQLRQPDAGSRTAGAPGLPALPNGPLSLAVLGACVHQRRRARALMGLEQLEGRGPPRAGPFDASATRSLRGAPAHLPRASALTHPHGWAPVHRASRTPELPSTPRRSHAVAARNRSLESTGSTQPLPRAAPWPARPPPNGRQRPFGSD